MINPEKPRNRGNFLRRNARNIALAGGLAATGFGAGVSVGVAMNFIEVSGNIQEIQSDARYTIAEQQNMTERMERSRSNQGLILFANTMLALGGVLGANAVRKGNL